MEHPSLIHFWSVLDLITLWLTVIAAGALCLLGRALRPKLTILPICALWQLIANVALFFIALRPVPNRAYWYGYHYAGIGENLLLIGLAVELTAALLPRKQFALGWCMALATLALLSIGSVLPARRESAILNATMAGDMLAALTLVALLYFPNVKIPRSLQFVIAGILTPAAIHAMCAFHWLQAGKLAAFAAALLPISSLAGLLLMLAGCGAGRSECLTRKVSLDASNENCEIGPTNRGMLARLSCLYYP
jgi:hypothetical protein